MTNHQTVRHRNRRKRIIGWTLIYLLILAGFIAIIYRQSIKVNTLDFPSGKIQLVVSKPQYTVGDTITYTINNGLSSAITLVNNCPKEPLHVYQWTNSTWVRIHDSASATTCANQPKQSVIAAQSSLTSNFTGWANLFSKPGIYRLVAYADNYTDIPYADFQVIAAPVVAAPVVAPAPQIIYKTIIQVQKVLVPVPTPSND